MDGFAPFGLVHLLVVGVCALLLGAIARLGPRLQGKPQEWRVRQALAIFALIYWVAYNTWWNWDGLDLRTGLPLQACDISGLVAPFALLTLNRWLRSLLYFWAFAFATQAFIQPTLTQGPAHVVFWPFWIAHTLILSCAIYDLAVLDSRPDWSAFPLPAILSVAYVAIVLPLNLWLGANYGFVGDPPAGTRIPPFLEAIGPWPQRLIGVFALAAVAFLAALAPWL